MTIADAINAHRAKATARAARAKAIASAYPFSCGEVESILLATGDNERKTKAILETALEFNFRPMTMLQLVEQYERAQTK